MDAVGEGRRMHGIVVSAAFFIGVVLSILGLGIAASYWGRLLAGWSAGFAVTTAIVSLVVGVAALFGPQLRRRIPAPTIHQRSGVGGAFLYGLAFTLATVTTGAGALLLVLTITAAIGRPAYGAALSLAYGIGRGAPFLLLGIFAGTVGSWLARVEYLRRKAEIVSGIALIAMAGYFFHLAGQLA